MSINAGRLYADDGAPNKGSACGKLLAWFQGQGHRDDVKGQAATKWYTGRDLDQVALDIGVRAWPTRKSELLSQANPRVEWVEHKPQRRTGGNVHLYRHVYTRGQLPTTYGDQSRQTLLRRLERLEGATASQAALPRTKRQAKASVPSMDATSSTPPPAATLFPDDQRPY